MESILTSVASSFPEFVLHSTLTLNVSEWVRDTATRLGNLVSARTFVNLRKVFVPTAWIIALGVLLSACTTFPYTGSLEVPPRSGPLTRIGLALIELPAPTRRVNVAVYDFPDLTGQNRPNATYADYSRAITQGAPAIVANALKSAGGGKWFNLVERTNLDSLLRERRLIQDTYEVLKQSPREKIKPLEFADYLVTGGIISFDAGILSGSLNASYAGVGGGISHNRNLVTINIRLVKVKDGSVIKSIDVSRPIISGSGSVSADRSIGGRPFVAEASLTLAEATQIAVREAIETGVYELIREGLSAGLWTLQEPRAASVNTTGARTSMAAASLRR